MSAGMSELVARMMAGPNKKQKGRANAQTTDELAQRLRARHLDRATKVTTSLGDSVLTCAISQDEAMFAGAAESPQPFRTRPAVNKKPSKTNNQLPADNGRASMAGSVEELVS